MRTLLLCSVLFVSACGYTDEESAEDYTVGAMLGGHVAATAVLSDAGYVATWTECDASPDWWDVEAGINWWFDPDGDGVYLALAADAGLDGGDGEITTRQGFIDAFEEVYRENWAETLTDQLAARPWC